MEHKKKKRYKILIADDSEMNRAILSDILKEEYEIIEAENGAQAVMLLQQHGLTISLVLLDFVMPKLNGFDVLKVMNQRNWIADIPVIMISAQSEAFYIERAYELGVTDFISRPFDALIVYRRVANTILLYAKQKKLTGLVAQQIYEKEKQSGLMVDILSHIVEFRNGESGLHVVHIRILTELLLKQYALQAHGNSLSRLDISLMATASALHDIGKIAISSEILNKPGKLTQEEFRVMQTHTLIGAKMLKELPVHQDNPLVKIAYSICRSHHERYDGNGYPDGLKGDAIPLPAQIVALADVYDALTSERVYKKAYSHETTIQMILDGQCGAFNPLLLKCLTEIADTIPMELNRAGQTQTQQDITRIAQELLRRDVPNVSDYLWDFLDQEREKYSFFTTISQEIQFEFTSSPPMVMVSEWSAQKLGIPEVIMDPLHNESILSLIDAKSTQELTDAIRSTSPENPVVEHTCRLCFDGEKRKVKFICRATWSADDPPRYLGVIGKTVALYEEPIQKEPLERAVSYDDLTGLLNRTYAKTYIQERIKARPNAKYAFLALDLDSFRTANDTRGHLFGDRILVNTAKMLRERIGPADIAARIGGDEFMIFLEYEEDIHAVIQRIFSSLPKDYEDFPVSISMGVALSLQVGADYESLFRAADQALYSAKRCGAGQCCFYQHSHMHNQLEGGLS